MKTRFKKMTSILLVFVMMLSVSGISVLAADPEPLPTAIDAPDIIVYDSGNYTTELYVKIKTPKSVMDIYEKGYENRVYDNTTYEYISDYGEYYLAGSYIQLDWKIDDGDWQYTSEWDTNYYAGNSYSYDSFSGEEVSETGIGSASSYYTSGVALQLSEMGCLIETTDGYSTYYRMDTDNHKVTVRVRYYFVFRDSSYQQTILLSDWSEEAIYGQGNKEVSEVPSSLSAPDIKNPEIYSIDYYSGYPEVQFELYRSDDVLNAMMWSEQYDEALEDSEMQLVIETCLDPNFGAGQTVQKETVYESSVMKKTIKYDYLFYDLWYDLPTSDEEAFVWNGETVYIRAKWINERKVNGSWSEIESPYSDVISIKGPVITAYDITITHGTYGFDSDGYYTESYRITQDCELDSFYCSPLEGCYVDTVTVNGVLMYDYEDESTYELLYWWDNYTNFEFIDSEDNYATQDLDVQITYAGTPTEKYGITTEYSSGGDLYTNSGYYSWENNSLVVYHGSEPKIYIEPNTGFIIESVLIDGEENEQAKEDGYYTFPAITDNSHSIEVTFKRVAYRVSYWAGQHGSISSDYEWYNGIDGYVLIGDDVTFTFEPDGDGNGNYYEIESVYIDYVVNEGARAARTYTFENVQANHSIDVYFSSDPVITHDITATSGENGSISPEGVVHAREGSTQRFYFIPDDGYEVDKVFVDDTEITNLATKEYYNISNVTEEHTIHVTFKKLPVQYEVNVLVSGHNPSVHSVSPRGVTPVWEGESFSVSFAPFAGYDVEKVLVDGAAVTADGTYTIAAVNADTVIEIFFKIKNYTVTFTDYDGTVLKTETVEHGSQATAPEDPEREHYVFIGWDTEFSDVTTNVTIRATYKPAEYTVEFIGWDGSELKTETVTYAEDATAPEAPEREGYDFAGWSRDYTNVSADLEVIAVYTQKEYTVIFVDYDDSVISTQTVKHGEAATAPADPSQEGYTFIGWDNTGYGQVTQDMNIKAMYVEGAGVTYTVTSRALGNTGSVSPVGVTTVQENGSLVLNFTPDSLSKIIKVVVDGTEIEVCDSYTFTNITANHTIDVYFAPTAVINVGTDNTEYGTASGHYDLIDDEVVYIIDVTPADGYELDGIYINGEKVDAELTDGRYVISDLTDDMDIDVRFRLIDGDGDDTSDDTSEDGNVSDDISDDGSDDGDDTPQTGDSTNIFLWFALLAASVLGIAVMTRKRRTVK